MTKLLGAFTFLTNPPTQNPSPCPALIRNIPPFFLEVTELSQIFCTAHGCLCLMKVVIFEMTKKGIHVIVMTFFFLSFRLEIEEI